jgi:hypothetical protein
MAAAPAVACSDDDDSPKDRVEYRDIEPYRVPPTTLEEIARGSEAVAILTVTKRLDDYWGPQIGPEIMVASRYEARIDQVLSGDLTEGETIVLHAAGGRVADRPIPAVGGSLKPLPDDDTVDVVYRGFPRFREGTQELVFLGRAQLPDGSVYFTHSPEARFRLEGGKFVSVIRTDPSSSRGPEGPAEVELPPAITANIDGHPRDQALGHVTATLRAAGK